MGSDLLGRRRGRASSAAAGTLNRTATATPNMTVDAPGNYTVQLTVTEPDGTSGSDQLTLQVAPAPLVAVHTMAVQNGVPGVLVGGMFYGASASKWVQIVVLNRRTLELVPNGNREFDCPAADSEPYAGGDSFVVSCTQPLRAYLSTLNSSDLVIASSQRPTAPGGPDPNSAAWRPQPPVGVDGTLHGTIGTQTIQFHGVGRMLRGRFSAIGVPGLPAGTGHQHGNPDVTNFRDDGQINGYLLVNNEANYAFVSAEHLQFNTQAPASNANQGVVDLGGKQFTAPIPASSRGGFVVAVADRQGLDGQAYYFDTGEPGDPTATFRQMLGTLQNADNGDNLVVISSRGDPSVRASAGEIGDVGALNDTLQHLVDAVEDLGGTRTRMFDMLDSTLWSANSYTLVGHSHSGAATGVETQGQNTSGAHALNTAPVQGLLARSAPDHGFEVETNALGNELLGPGLKVIQTLYQGPTAWPDQGNPGRQAAIKFISNQPSVNLGDDPRGQYWTESWDPFGAGQTFWYGKRDAIKALDGSKYSGNAADFAWAQQELQDEISWLVQAHAYMTQLTAPFKKGADTTWSQLISVSEQVKNDTQTSDPDKVTAIVLAVLDGARNTADALPSPAGNVITAINTVYDTAVRIATIAGATPPPAPFGSTVGKVASDLSTRLQAAQDTIEFRMPNAIAADYGKLRTLGLCGALRGDCPGGADPWQISADADTLAVQGMRAGIESSIYGALLPARYSAFSLPFDYYRVANAKFRGDSVGGFSCMFRDEPANAQVARPINLDIPQHRNRRGAGQVQIGERWEVRPLGFITGKGAWPSDQFVMHTPKASVVDRLFNPPSMGGLGVYPEKFFVNNFSTRTLDHYPYTDSEVRWDDDPTCNFGPTFPNPYAVRFNATRATADRRGFVSLPFRFLAATSGNVTLRAGRVVIGRASFSVTGAGRRLVRIGLSRRGRSLLARARAHRLGVQASILFRQAGRVVRGTARLTLSSGG